jgi:catechol-2,3-dioxygenase
VDEAQRGEFLAKLGTRSTIQIVSLCVKTKRFERIMEELHHIALPVNDIGKAVNWYEKNFDVSKVYEDESWALLAFENISLALVLPGQHPAHIAVKRENAEKHGKLTKHRDGSSSVYVTDPWGNAVEYLKSVP